MNRPRHRATLCSLVRSSAATALFSLPSAQASTIFARSASTCDVFPRRAHRASCSRSAPVSTRSAFRRPGRGASASPAVPDSVNRERHFRTVSTESPSSAATPELPSAESAQASTIPRTLLQAAVPGTRQPLKLSPVLTRQRQRRNRKRHNNSLQINVAISGGVTLV